MWVAAMDLKSGAMMLVMLVAVVGLIGVILVLWALQLWRRSLRGTLLGRRKHADEDPWTLAGQRLKVDETEHDDES